jgi:hypothetical protein
LLHLSFKEPDLSNIYEDKASNLPGFIVLDLFLHLPLCSWGYGWEYKLDSEDVLGGI